MFSGIEPDGVLAMQAATLASAMNLAANASTIQAVLDGVDDLVPGAPKAKAKSAPVTKDLAELAGWAKAIALKFVDDERPLQQLRTAGYWLPDLTKLGWDGSKSATENLETTARSDEFGAFELGLAQSLLERYRSWKLVVPKPDAPTLRLPVPDAVVKDTKLIRLPSGFFVPQGGSADPTVPRLAEVSRGPNFFQPDTKNIVLDGPGRPPTWARYGGRGLFVAGTALTLYDAGMSQWEQDQKYHPEWDTPKRVASAGYNVATEGGGAVAGGIAGAELGATVGSFIPIPVIGTVGGALVGGAIGAFVGSRAGKAGGVWVREKMAAPIADGAKKAWKSLFG